MIQTTCWSMLCLDRAFSLASSHLPTNYRGSWWTLSVFVLLTCKVPPFCCRFSFLAPHQQHVRWFTYSQSYVSPVWHQYCKYMDVVNSSLYFSLNFTEPATDLHTMKPKCAAPKHVACMGESMESLPLQLCHWHAMHATVSNWITGVSFFAQTKSLVPARTLNRARKLCHSLGQLGFSLPQHAD